MNTVELLQAELKETQEELGEIEGTWLSMSGYEVSVATAGLGGDGWGGLTIEQIEEHDRRRESSRYSQSNIEFLKAKIERLKKEIEVRMHRT
jgi:hypothetical protein